MWQEHAECCGVELVCWRLSRSRLRVSFQDWDKSSIFLLSIIKMISNVPNIPDRCSIDALFQDLSHKWKIYFNNPFYVSTMEWENVHHWWFVLTVYFLLKGVVFIFSVKAYSRFNKKKLCWWVISLANSNSQTLPIKFTRHHLDWQKRP